MSRGLPWSALLHALALTLVVLYGDAVQRRPVETPLLIRARLVPAAALAAPAAEAIAEPLPEAAPPPADPVPLQPKEVPQDKPKPKPKPAETRPQAAERKPEAKPDLKPDQATAGAAAQTGAAAASGPSVQGTDADFPFAWYIATIEGQINRNWRPQQLGFGATSRYSCVVHFVVARNGTISQVNLVDGSGVGVYDREALRAVQATRLPPLPPQYGAANLGVTFVFNLVQGL